jgi:hypothetical protein
MYTISTVVQEYWSSVGVDVHVYINCTGIHWADE